MHLAGLGIAVLAGAGVQRITGLGFALVAAPFLVLLLGPFDGVLLVNVCSVITASLVLTQVWRDVDVRRAAVLLASAVPAVIPGAWAARSLSAPVLAILIGGLVLAALVAVLASEEARVLRGRPGAVIAGAGSGFMNVTAGVGGPAITVYAVSTGWPHRTFAATAQLIFAVIGIASLLAKGRLPSLSAAGWAVTVVGLAIGILAGNRITDRVPAHRARQGVIVLAIAGAVATVGKGVLQLT